MMKEKLTPANEGILSLRLMYMRHVYTVHFLSKTWTIKALLFLLGMGEG